MLEFVDTVLVPLRDWFVDQVGPHLNLILVLNAFLALVAVPVLIQIGKHTARNSIQRLEGDIDHARRSEALARSKAEASELLARGAVEELSAHTARIRNAIDGDVLTRGFETEFRPPQMSGAQSRIPIIAVGNLKGGVGKTTLAANLGAYLADMSDTGPGHKNRVLFVDLDFQGSLSETMIGVSGGANLRLTERLFRPDSRPEGMWQEAKPVIRAGLNAESRYFDCGFDSASFEERLLFGWAMSGKSDWAVRTALAKVLKDPKARAKLDPNNGADRLLLDWAGSFDTHWDPRVALSSFLRSPIVQDRFDAVILDLPPRNTLFAFNALIASTDLVVPTRLDQISATSVARFLRFANNHRMTLWPDLNVVGVIGTMTQAGAIAAAERPLIGEIITQANESWQKPGNKVEFIGHVPTRAGISQTAGRDFAYLDRAGGASSPNAVLATACKAIVEKVLPRYEPTS